MPAVSMPRFRKTSGNGETHGPILDLRNIPWVRADGRKEAYAWAPCIKKLKRRYFFYLSVGPQSPGFPAHIGVVVGNSPAGPFKDSGAPLLTGGKHHKGPGHHSVARHPKSGDWLIIYHRWENALGEGPYRGSRQTAVDRLIHLPDGTIEAVRMDGAVR